MSYWWVPSPPRHTASVLWLCTPAGQDLEHFRGHGIINLLRSSFGELRALVVDIIDEVLEAVVRLGHPGAGEGVGLHDVRASLEVSLVDLVDDVRAGDGQKVVISLQRLHMIRQLLVAEIWFLQFVLLQRGPHSAVKNHDPLPQRLSDLPTNFCTRKTSRKSTKVT